MSEISKPYKPECNFEDINVRQDGLPHSPKVSFQTWRRDNERVFDRKITPSIEYPVILCHCDGTVRAVGECLAVACTLKGMPDEKGSGESDYDYERRADVGRTVRLMMEKCAFAGARRHVEETIKS